MKKIKINIHWSFVVLGILMLIFGKFSAFFFAMITVFLHELGHSFVGRKLGYKLDLITLLPYGAMLSGKNTPFSVKDEIIIALAGPFVNLIIIILNLILSWTFPTIFSINNPFFISNFYTLIFNILPVYPLDGGRILVALLSLKMPRINAQKKTKRIGYFITTIFFILFFVSFLFDLNYMLGINALFMLIGLFGEDSAPYYEKINAFEKFNGLKNAGKVIFIDKGQSIFNAYKFMNRSGTKTIKICDNGRVIKQLSKNQVLSGVLNNPIDTKIENLEL